jgi:hypothetical protein
MTMLMVNLISNVRQPEIPVILTYWTFPSRGYLQTTPASARAALY